MLSFMRASRFNIIGSQHISSWKPKLIITNRALKNVPIIFPYFIFRCIRLGRGHTLGRLWSPGDGPHESGTTTLLTFCRVVRLGTWESPPLELHKTTNSQTLIKHRNVWRFLNDCAVLCTSLPGTRYFRRPQRQNQPLDPRGVSSVGRQ